MAARAIDNAVVAIDRIAGRQANRARPVGSTNHRDQRWIGKILGAFVK